ncbi:MAG: aldehyde dehydrogenase family protein [Sandaracinaceae bacterium]
MTQTNLESPLLDRIGGYVAGAWITEGDTFDVHDPADGSLLARVPRLGAQHARDAVEAARDALAGGPVPIAARQERLHDIASLLHESSAELARIITRENGKPLSEARAEVAYAAGFYAHAAEEVPHLASRVLDERPRDHRWTVHHRAAGVAALITPWNFPIAMLAKKLSAAIAAGCTTVIKPARATPLTCIAFVRLLERLELAPGEVNLVVGDAGPIGDVLAEHPAVRVISFTGSTAVGQKLAAKAAPTLKRLSLELGGNAPCLVFADADLDAAVERLVANKFRASGQT